MTISQMHVGNYEEVPFECKIDSFYYIPYIGTPFGHEEQGRDHVDTHRP